MGNKFFQNSNIEMLLLKILKEKDMYGYEIIQQLDILSESNISLKAGTIYPLLHNLENAGYVISYEKPTEGKLIRKYYKITEEGSKCLEDKIQNWTEYFTIINHVLGV